MTKRRYNIEPLLNGRYCIVHPREDEWKWAGDHWSETHAITFADLREAFEYAKEIFGEPAPKQSEPFQEGANA